MIDLGDILSSSSEAYKLIFDHYPQGVIITTPEGVVIHCNNATITHLDTSYDSLIGKSIVELFSNVAWLDLMSSKVVQRASRIAYDNELYDLTIQALESEGICFIFVKPSSINEVTHDLQESLNRFETLAQLAPIGIFLVDANGQNLFVNTKWKELSGLTSQDAKGSGWTKAIYHEDLSLVEEGWGAFLKGEKSFDYEYRYIHQDSKKITHVHCITVPFLDKSNRATGYVGVVQDVSVARELRSKLEENNQLLEQQVYDRSSDLLANQSKLRKACRLARLGHWEITIIDELKINWSKEYIDIFEPQQEIEKKNARFFLQFTNPDDQGKVVDSITEAIRKGVDTLIEYRITTGTGIDKFLQEEIQCYKNEDGKVIRVFGVTQDITELKKSEQNLLNALAQERDLSVLKSRFVSIASHEFRTPLTAILSSAELISLYGEKQDFVKVDKHAKKIMTSVEHLTYILEDFLSLEKVESGNVHTKREPIQLSLFITDVLEEMSLLIKDHSMSYDHTGLDNHMVDKNILRNILHNLISNAIKYSPTDKPINITSSSEDGSSIKISVSDQGIGIPLAEQHNMFRRFFRASNTSTIQGTGLGLTIVSRYLDIVGGSIDFSSTPGQGTTFNIHIPTAHEG